MKPKKQRPDSPLRNLSETRQAALYAMMLPGPENQSYAQIKKYLLAEFNLTVSLQALSNFFSSYGLRQRYASAEETRRLAVEERRRTHPEETEESLFAFGQQIFANEALANQDVKAWADVQKLRQKSVDQANESRRIALLEAAAAKADQAEQVTTSTLSPEEKDRRMRAIFGLQ